MLVVAPGEPGVPVICWATAEVEISSVRVKADRNDFWYVMAALPYRLLHAQEMLDVSDYWPRVSPQRIKQSDRG